MPFAFKQDAAWVEIVGPFIIGEGDDAIQYPVTWPDGASEEELAAAGVFPIVEPGDPPSDAIVTGSTLVGDAAPARVWTVEDLPFADFKSLYASRAETIRDLHLNGGCETPSGRVDTDPESRLNISGSVQMAAILGEAFQVSWRRADNSYIQLNAAAMTAIGLAAGQHVATCYATCFAIKDAITAAPTRDAVRAIDLQAGYPE